MNPKSSFDAQPNGESSADFSAKNIAPAQQGSAAPAAPPAGKLRTIAGNLIAMCGSILFGILAFEGVYRIYPFDAMDVRPPDDRPLLYYMAKGAHRRSDYPHQAAKPAGVFRIVTIGDSFTYPTFMQFDDAFPKRLERILNLAHPDEKRAEVLNLGRMGLSTSREVREVAEALHFQPDLVLLEITLNDAELRNFHLEQKLHPDKYNFGDYKVTPQNHPILSHFRGLSFLYERLSRIGSKNSVADYYVNSFKDPKNHEIFRQSLTEIKALADKSGVPIAAVVFPMFYTDIDDDYPFAEIHTIIRDDLTARNISFLDLREAFRGIPHTRLNVMVGKDTHPNEIAHRIAAENIYEWMQHTSLIPPDLFAPEMTAESLAHSHGAHRGRSRTSAAK